MTTETKRPPLLIVAQAKIAADNAPNIGAPGAITKTIDAIGRILSGMERIAREINQRAEEGARRSRWTNMERPALVALYGLRKTTERAARAADMALGYYDAEFPRLTPEQRGEARRAAAALVKLTAEHVAVFAATADRLADEADEEAARKAAREARGRALELADGCMDVRDEAMRLADTIRTAGRADALIAANIDDLAKWAAAWQNGAGPAAAEAIGEGRAELQHAADAFAEGRREDAARNVGRAGMAMERAAGVASAGEPEPADERRHPCGCAWGAHHFMTCPEA